MSRFKGSHQCWSTGSNVVRCLNFRILARGVYWISMVEGFSGCSDPLPSFVALLQSIAELKIKTVKLCQSKRLSCSFPQSMWSRHSHHRHGSVPVGDDLLCSEWIMETLGFNLQCCCWVKEIGLTSMGNDRRNSLYSDCVYACVCVGECVCGCVCVRVCVRASH